MSDYLAEVSEYMGRSEQVLYPALASIAESLHTIASALTPPQGATGAGDGANPGSRPAEPSLVALDVAEAEVVRAAGAEYALWEPDAFRQSSEWWASLARLHAAVDRLGGAV